MINNDADVTEIIVYVTDMANFWGPNGSFTYSVDFYTTKTLF